LLNILTIRLDTSYINFQGSSPQHFVKIAGFVKLSYFLSFTCKHWKCKLL